MNLSTYMLKEKREEIISMKALIIRYLIKLVDLLKVEPTKENTTNPNTHIWIDIWDEFDRCNQVRPTLFHAIRKLFLAEHEHDPVYRDRISVIGELFVEAVLDGKIKPRSLDHPYNYWRDDPNIRGKGYEFIKEKFHQARRQRDNFIQ